MKNNKKLPEFLHKVLLLQGIVPVERSQISMEIITGITLSSLAIPEVMGYSKIAGMPAITGL